MEFSLKPSHVIGFAMILLSIAFTLGNEDESLAPTVKPLEGEALSAFFETKPTDIPIETLHRALISGQTYASALAAEHLGLRGDASSIPFLIDALANDTMYVGGGRACFGKPGENTTRYWANQSLLKLTGQDFDFDWNASPEDRKKAISRWTHWYLTKPSGKKVATSSQP